MKKIITVVVSIGFILALTGCTGNKTSDLDNNKVKNEETNIIQSSKLPPKNLPVYPDAKRFGDVKSFTYAKNTYLEWYYETSANAEEIVDFFKKEFQNLGLEIMPYGTYIQGSQFSVTAWEPGVQDKTIAFVSNLESENLSDEIDGKTTERQYAIRINIDMWNN